MALGADAHQLRPQIPRFALGLGRAAYTSEWFRLS